MTTEQLKHIELFRLSMEQKARDIIEDKREFPSFIYIITSLNDEWNVRTEFMNPYLENYQSKLELIRLIHSQCYEDMNSGYEILAVGCIMDCYFSQRENKDKLTGDQYNEWVRYESNRLRPIDDPNRKDAIESILCFKNKTQSWSQFYRIERGEIIFDHMKKSADDMIHEGTFAKLYPPDRSQLKTVKITIIDAAFYDPKCIPETVAKDRVLYMRILGRIREEIIKDKAAGKQIILLKFPDHSGIHFNVNRSHFDKLISLPRIPENTKEIIREVGRHTHDNYGWDVLSEIKMLMGEPHQHLK